MFRLVEVNKVKFWKKLVDFIIKTKIWIKILDLFNLEIYFENEELSIFIANYITKKTQINVEQGKICY